MVSRDIPFEEQVEARMERLGPDACWPWRGSMRYGRPVIRDRSILLYVYQREWGLVPPGFKVIRIDHDPTCEKDCVHVRCVNPRHLSIAPNGGPRKTGRRLLPLCNRGHDLSDPDNVYVWPSGQRQCRQCRAIYRADWKRRNPSDGTYRRKRRKKWTDGRSGSYG